MSFQKATQVKRECPYGISNVLSRTHFRGVFKFYSIPIPINWPHLVRNNQN